MTDSLLLNWSCQNTLITHQSLFEQSDLFPMLEAKRQYYSEYTFTEQLVENGFGLVAAGFPTAAKYVTCGYKTKFGRRPCKLWQLCPVCAYHKKKKAWARYGDSFAGHTFDFLTLSFKEAVPFGYVTKIWFPAFREAAFEAVKDFIAAGCALGVYVTFEVSIQTYKGTPHALPHAHAVVHVNERLGNDAKAHLEAFFEGYSDEEGFTLPVDPSIDIRPISSDRSFLTRLGYCTKAMDIMKPYRTDISDISTPREIRELNLNFRNFLSEWRGLSQGEAKIAAYGTLDARRRSIFIGTSPKDREDTLTGVIARQQEYRGQPWPEEDLHDAS